MISYFSLMKQEIYFILMNKILQHISKHEGIIRILLLLLIDELLENFAFIPLNPHIGFLIDNILFKVFSLTSILLLNFLILKQRVYFKPIFLKIKLKNKITFTILFIILFFMPIMEQSSTKILEAITIGLIAAIPEEYLYRGIVLGGFLKYLKSTKLRSEKSRIIFCLVASSLLFSLIHISNVIFDGTLNTFCQIIQTFGFGLLAGSFYIAYSSLLAPIALHFLLDFELTISNGLEQNTQVAASDIPSYILTSFIIAIFYIIIGISVLHRANYHKLLTKINS